MFSGPPSLVSGPRSFSREGGPCGPSLVLPRATGVPQDRRASACYAPGGAPLAITFLFMSFSGSKGWYKWFSGVK